MLYVESFIFVKFCCKPVYCSVDSCVVVLDIINIDIVAICNNSLSSKKNYSMHSHLVHLGDVRAIRKFLDLNYYGVCTSWTIQSCKFKSQ